MFLQVGLRQWHHIHAVRKTLEETSDMDTCRVRVQGVIIKVPTLAAAGSAKPSAKHHPSANAFRKTLEQVLTTSASCGVRYSNDIEPDLQQL